MIQALSANLESLKEIIEYTKKKEEAENLKNLIKLIFGSIRFMKLLFINVFLWKGTRISQPEVAYELCGQLYLVTKEVVYALDIKISLTYNA